VTYVVRDHGWVDVVMEDVMEVETVNYIIRGSTGSTCLLLRCGPSGPLLPPRRGPTGSPPPQRPWSETITDEPAHHKDDEDEDEGDLARRSSEQSEIELKCWPQYFDALRSGRKSFEVRKDDRLYVEGAILRIREWVPETSSFTGRELRLRVTYVVRGPTAWGFPSGWVVMGVASTDESTTPKQTGPAGPPPPPRRGPTGPPPPSKTITDEPTHHKDDEDEGDLVRSRRLSEELKHVELCGCEESMLYRRQLREVRDWLFELGAGNHTMGPMNEDDGAAEILAHIEGMLELRADEDRQDEQEGLTRRP
jgi:hypothetical protein